jgi:hypothetical protein
MDELQTIREALEDYKINKDWHLGEVALAALSRLEAFASEWPDAQEIAKRVIEAAHQNIDTDEIDSTEATALIGQYAYRYSEDIRKDRDEWRDLAKDFALAVQSKEAIK